MSCIEKGDTHYQKDNTKKSFTAYNGLIRLRIHICRQLSSIALRNSQYSRNMYELEMKHCIIPEPFLKYQEANDISIREINLYQEQGTLAFQDITLEK